MPSSRAFKVAFSLSETMIRFEDQRCPSKAPSPTTRQGNKLPCVCPYDSLGWRADHHLLIFLRHVEERERHRTLATPSPGHIKDHELKAIRLSAHKNRKIERKTAQERPRAQGLTGQKSPPWQSPGRRQSHTIPPGRPRYQWRSRSKEKSMFSRMGANVPDGSRRVPRIGREPA